MHLPRAADALCIPSMQSMSVRPQPSHDCAYIASHLGTEPVGERCLAVGVGLDGAALPPAQLLQCRSDAHLHGSHLFIQIINAIVLQCDFTCSASAACPDLAAKPLQQPVPQQQPHHSKGLPALPLPLPLSACQLLVGDYHDEGHVDASGSTTHS